MRYPDSISPEELRIRMDNQDNTREERANKTPHPTGISPTNSNLQRSCRAGGWAQRSAENIMKGKRIIHIIAAILISLSFAHAELIGKFPGLDKLIKEADAIVILRIDQSDGDFGGRELYSTHDCYIYQSLKGDIPTKKRIRLKLMDARQHSPNLFAYQSTLLVFLTKKRAPIESTDYRVLETKGSAILLPPTGQEAAPLGETVSDKIRSILQRAIEYNEKEREKEKSFLQGMIQGGPTIPK